MVEAEAEAAGEVGEQYRRRSPAGPGRGQVGGDRGGAGAALDAADRDQRRGAWPGGRRLAGGGHPGQLGGQVGGAVGPGEQAAGAGGQCGAQVGRAVVVADGEHRRAAAGW